MRHVYLRRLVMHLRSCLWAICVASIVAGCSPSHEIGDPATAAADDLRRRSASTCSASADITWEVPADLGDQVAAASPGWLWEDQIFVGRLEGLAERLGGTYFGIEDDRGYVNALLSDGTWATYVAQRAASEKEAWLIRIVKAVPCRR
jgi:hypothetical protein